MYISEIKAKNNINYASPLFNGRQVVAKKMMTPSIGKLSFSTSRNLGDVLRAYKDIRTKLASVTKEGLEHIQKEYPNVTIGESLIFHNCGEFNTSILVRCAESIENFGLSRIIERKGNSSWSDRIVINSFLFDGDDKLLRNTDENKQKLYPKDREYLTDKEIETQGLENSLLNVLNNLDPALLEFRQYLKTVDSKYYKVPDGMLPFSLLEKLNQIKRDNTEIEAALKKLPTAVGLAVRKSYPDYKLITGLTTHAFENLGEEKVSLTYNPILSPGMQNLRRLNVFDENGKLIRTFVATTEGRMVSNLNQNYTTHLPEKLIFADAEAIKKDEFLPSFEKYLTMYSQKLAGLKSHVNEFLAERLRLLESTPVEFPDKMQKDFTEVMASIDNVNKILAGMPVLKGIEVKNNVPELYTPAGKKGLFFDGFMQDKRVHLLLMKSRFHNDLVRITITDAKGKDKMFLIKDGKYLVKNFNPKYPQTLPKTLLFTTEADGDFDEELVNVMSYLKDKMVTYEEIAREGLNKYIIQEQEKAELKEIRKLKKEKALQEHKELLRQQREAARLNREAELYSLDNKEVLERKDLLASCKTKLSAIKQNIHVETAEFENMLTELKSLIENFGKRKE